MVYLAVHFLNRFCTTFPSISLLIVLTAHGNCTHPSPPSHVNSGDGSGRQRALELPASFLSCRGPVDPPGSRMRASRNRQFAHGFRLQTAPKADKRNQILHASIYYSIRYKMDHPILDGQANSQGNCFPAENAWVTTCRSNAPARHYVIGVVQPKSEPHHILTRYDV